MKNIAIAATVIFTLFVSVMNAQNPYTSYSEAKAIRFDLAQPIIGYTLRVNGSDLSSYQIEMHVRNVKDTFRIAIVTHPEYDDMFWRYVVGIRAETPAGKASVVRKDSALWQVVATGSDVLIRYSIKLPAPEGSQRAAWIPFLSSTGGLVGGPHSFMYVVGSTLAPSHVTLEIPRGWRIATGMESTSDPSTFFAPSTGILVDSPFLIGLFKSWPFSVDQVPHRIIYWPSPNAKPFDSTALVRAIKGFVEQAASLFGRLPYREYSFILQDASYGGLEHLSSVVLGTPSDEFASNIYNNLDEISHEYFHTWNLMRIHPVEYGDVGYVKPQPSSGLWWSEGLTLFYSDLLRRRANIPTYDSSRTKHLERLMRSYFNYSGNSTLSPEKVSLAEYGAPGMLGDYLASTHLQGEISGNLLDIIIRETSDGRRSIDDVMRRMLERFSGQNGFNGRDIEQVVADVCGCDMTSFFDKHIRGANEIDFNHFLKKIGMRYTLGWEAAKDDKGKLLADLWISGFQLPGEKVVRIKIYSPTSCWGKAGLHTGDQIKLLNGSAVKSERDFWNTIRAAHIGDKFRFVVQRPTGDFKTTVVITGYQKAIVHIEEIQAATKQQIELRQNWLAGKP